MLGVRWLGRSGCGTQGGRDADKATRWGQLGLNPGRNQHLQAMEGLPWISAHSGSIPRFAGLRSRGRTCPLLGRMGCVRGS